jgi:GDSL-like Lipase/Acylhydrolase
MPLHALAGAGRFQVVAFGDSLLDAGTYEPFAKVAFHGGRFTTNPGLNFTHDIARHFGDALTPAFVGGFGQPLSPAGGLNYAQGGSRVTMQPGIGHAPPGDSNADFAAATTVPVRDQVKAYLSAHHVFTPYQLVLINGGANDILFQLEAAQAVGTPQAKIAALEAIVQSAIDLSAIVASVVEKGATHVLVMNLPDVGYKRAGRQIGSEKIALERPEIREAVLGKNPPIVCDGIFDSAARRPAGAGARSGGSGKNWGVRSSKREGGLETAEGDTSGAIDEGAVQCDTELAADRTPDVARGLCREVAAPEGKGKGGDGRVGQARPIERALDPQDQLVELILVTNMSTADHPAGRAVNGTVDNGAGKRIEPGFVKGAGGPDVTKLATDKYAGPSEQRRRQIGWRRRVAKVSGESRRSGENKGTKRCLERLPIHKIFLQRG